MRRRTLLAAPAILQLRSVYASTNNSVDVLLVLAVDISYSVDEREARLQREGYRKALCDPHVVRTIEHGMLGAVGVVYIEWAGFEYQRLVLPWTRISSQAEAEAWSSDLAQARYMSLAGTSISGAIDYSRRMFAEAPFEGTRRVIDISGDGVNNSGRPAGQASDEAVAAGITINGLPILESRPSPAADGYAPLDHFYREHVIGGPGAFMVVADGFEAFEQAVRRKLIREIA